METTYSIGELAAKAYLAETEHRIIDTHGYECPEGKADLVCADPESTTLVFVTTKRRRKDTGLEPSYNKKRMQRIAMCYLVEHQGRMRLSCDAMCVLIGSGGNVTVSYVEGIYVWENEG